MTQARSSWPAAAQIQTAAILATIHQHTHTQEHTSSHHPPSHWTHTSLLTVSLRQWLLGQNSNTTYFFLTLEAQDTCRREKTNIIFLFKAHWCKGDVKCSNAWTVPNSNAQMVNSVALGCIWLLQRHLTTCTFVCLTGNTKGLSSWQHECDFVGCHKLILYINKWDSYIVTQLFWKRVHTFPVLI